MGWPGDRDDGGVGVGQATALLVTDDPALLDDLRRLAGAAGLAVQVVGAGGLSASQWSTAAVVLVGADVAAGVAARRLPGRERVMLVASDPSDWSVAVDLGAEHVVTLPDAEPWLVRHLGEVGEGPSRAGSCVAVTSAAGGLGVSTIAHALASAYGQNGANALLVDADPLGGGIDLLVAGEDAEGVRWGDLIGAEGRVSASTLAYALPRAQGMAVLAHPRGDVVTVPQPACDAVLDAALRGYDAVVIDAPRLSPLSVLLTADDLVLVVGAQLRGVMAARQGIRILADHGRQPRIAVRQQPGGLTSRDVSRALGIDDVIEIPNMPALRVRGEHGDPFVSSDAFGRAIVRLRELIGEQP